MEMREKDPQYTIGVGNYRIFSNDLRDVLNKVLSGVRLHIANGTSLTPIYNHSKANESKTGTDNPDNYYHKPIVNSDEEIIGYIKETWFYMQKYKYNYEKEQRVLLDLCGTTDRIIDFIFKYIKNEMDLVNDLFQQTDAEIDNDIIEIEKNRKISIKTKVDLNRAKVKKGRKITELLQNNEIDKLVDLIGPEILTMRLKPGERDGNSYWCWKTIQHKYGLTPTQVKRIRSSPGYHKLLADNCIKAVVNYRAKIEKGNKDGVYTEDYTFDPGNWYNHDRIKRAGAINFVEPDYN